ncbi:hypothetical protein E3N88_25997 [Mikania micrantha]|uniref:Uncharacterized protein n=1 Tax=Mikania micrantha TaxID=192012 RepID=A0A5N6N940_9ASTR|nr:hypothetical protein E3N88_25997 [Mikania micrantha]
MFHDDDEEDDDDDEQWIVGVQWIDMDDCIFRESLLVELTSVLRNDLIVVDELTSVLLSDSTVDAHELMNKLHIPRGIPTFPPSVRVLQIGIRA